MKKIILISTLANLLILEIPYCYSQSVGVNGSGNTPNVSALLDIDATGMSPKGILIPRIALTSATDAATIATPATSLLVYNTNGGLSPAGYYYNQGTSGSPNWVPFLTNNVNAPSAWSLTGNTGTTGGPNFLGTTDNISLRFRTNNTQKMIIDSLGNVGIGTTLPGYKLQVVGGFSVAGSNGGVFWSERGDSDFDIVAALGSTKRAISIHANSSGTGGNVLDVYGHNGTSFISCISASNNGNIGIGTTTPTSILDIVSNTNTQQYLRTYSNVANVQGYLFLHRGRGTEGVPLAVVSGDELGRIYFNGYNAGAMHDGAYIGGIVDGAPGATQIPTALVFNTSASAGSLTERMRINAIGDVGIGYTSPSYKLDVNGALRTDGIYGGQLNGAGNFHLEAHSAGGGRGIYANWFVGTGGFHVGNGAAGYGVAYASAFTVSSSKRFKKDISNIHYGLAQILKLQGKEFKYIKDPKNRNEIGFIAEEVEPIIPEVVYRNNQDEVMGIDYGKFSAILVEAIKEQQQQILQLKDTVEAMQKKIDRLEKK